TRAAMAALALADLSDGEYVTRQATAMLLPSEEWAARLERVERSAAERLAAHQAGVRETWFSELSRRLAEHRIPAPLPARDSAAHRIALDGVGNVIAREESALTERLSTSTIAAAGAAAAAPMIGRAAVRASRAGAARAASRGAARGASRIGGAALGGAAVCSPGGPAAAACAVLAGAGAWLATDWVLLGIDEHLNRDDLEQS